MDHECGCQNHVDRNDGFRGSEYLLSIRPKLSIDFTILHMIQKRKGHQLLQIKVILGPEG